MTRNQPREAEARSWRRLAEQKGGSDTTPLSHFSHTPHTSGPHKAQSRRQRVPQSGKSRVFSGIISRVWNTQHAEGSRKNAPRLKKPSPFRVSSPCSWLSVMTGEDFRGRFCLAEGRVGILERPLPLRLLGPAPWLRRWRRQRTVASDVSARSSADRSNWP